jgi:hypothetical protein
VAGFHQAPLAGLAMRVVFLVYLIGVICGITYVSVIGLAHH